MRKLDLELGIGVPESPDHHVVHHDPFLFGFVSDVSLDKILVMNQTAEFPPLFGPLKLLAPAQ